MFASIRARVTALTSCFLWGRNLQHSETSMRALIAQDMPAAACTPAPSCSNQQVPQRRLGPHKHARLQPCASQHEEAHRPHAAAAMDLTVLSRRGAAVTLVGTLAAFSTAAWTPAPAQAFQRTADAPFLTADGACVLPLRGSSGGGSKTSSPCCLLRT